MTGRVPSKAALDTTGETSGSPVGGSSPPVASPAMAPLGKAGKGLISPMGTPSGVGKRSKPTKITDAHWIASGGMGDPTP